MKSHSCIKSRPESKHEFRDIFALNLQQTADKRRNTCHLESSIATLPRCSSIEP